MVSTGLTAKDKQDKVKNLPNQLKGETAALTALSKGFAEIVKAKDKEAKSKQTPLTGISGIYDTKTEMTPNFTRLFKYVNQQQTHIASSNSTKVAQMNEVKA